MVFYPSSIFIVMTLSTEISRYLEVFVFLIAFKVSCPCYNYKLWQFPTRKCQIPALDSLHVNPTECIICRSCLPAHKPLPCGSPLARKTHEMDINATLLNESWTVYCGSIQVSYIWDKLAIFHLTEDAQWHNWPFRLKLPYLGVAVNFQPENLLYGDPSEEAPLKIADFGLSKILNGDPATSTVCGTPGYCGKWSLRQQSSVFSRADTWIYNNHAFNAVRRGQTCAKGLGPLAWSKKRGKRARAPKHN